jgi:dCMP deaminase
MTTSRRATGTGDSPSTVSPQTQSNPSPPRFGIKRPSIDEYFLNMLGAVAARSTCSRRAVGCILVDAKNRIVSTGYNGNAVGAPHCIDTACPGASLASGTGLDKCEAIHAEINALLRADPDRVHSAYVSCTPCIHCVKALLSSECQRIVALAEYPHPEARLLWTNASRSWIIMPPKADEGPYDAMRNRVGAFFPS